MNIKEVLIREYDFYETKETFDGNSVFVRDDGTKLITSSKDMISTNHLEDAFSAEVFIFCSRHRAKSGKPALLVHSTGNLGPAADFGGDPFSLSISCASLVSVALKSLFKGRNEHGLDEFDVTMEATHHGPTSMNTPLLFVELGSDEVYWEHKEGARIVADAAMACALASIEEECYIGFGGTHYVSKFNKLVLHNDVRIGHIAPNYALNDIRVDVVQQMIHRSKERVTAAIIDWKGTNSEQREHLIPILDQLGLELIRAKDI
jgi:D-aminoacyl-tRNA deacylase